MDCTVYGVAKSQTQLNVFHFQKYKQSSWHLLNTKFLFIKKKKSVTLRKYLKPGQVRTFQPELTGQCTVLLP